MTDILEIADRVRTRPPRVTVIGDAILDRWMSGDVTRLSREGPVPVVEVADRSDRPGGAANTAANLAALGASVRLLSVVGDDADGHCLLAALSDAGVDVSHVAVVPGGVTATKTRIVGADQILVRADVASADGRIPRQVAQSWRDIIGELVWGETLLVCDYGGDLLDESVARDLGIDRCAGRVVVDAHDLSTWRGLHPDVVTPNAQEAARLLADPLPHDGRPEAVAHRAAELLMSSGAGAAVVTLDRDGAVVLERGAGVTHMTASRPAPDVRATGAGDCFAAALAVAMGVGCTLPAASDFAQAAALVVVARPGTAVCDLDALEDSVRPPTAASLLPADRISEALHEAIPAGGVTVFVNGCFDLLHAGHAAHLAQARALGDILVVGLNDDASVERLKGPGRPVNPVADRARVVGALGCVDFVVVFGEDTPLRLLEALKPDIYAKGGDYADTRLPEMAFVEQYGGQVRILDFFAGHSTASLVDRVARGARLTHPQ